MKTKIKIAIADDHKMFRETLGEKLDEEEDITLVGSFGSGAELLAFLADKKADIVLLDIDMPEMDGHEVLNRMIERNPTQKTIIISFHEDSYYINKFMKLGASGYISKVKGYDEILDSIYTVYEKGIHISKEVSDSIVQSYLQENNPQINAKKVKFSDREIEVIKLVCQDKTAKEIAEALFIEAKTVEGHKLRIREKLGVKSSIGIVVYAMETGLYDPEN